MLQLRRIRVCAAVFAFAVLAVPARTQAQSVSEKYEKSEVRIAMRDGVKLFTAIYKPKDTSRQYPVMLLRTPYSVGPYGANAFRNGLGPSRLFQDEGFIFVYQDVRGRYMSEGVFDNMRPQRTTYKGPKDIDESTDTYDTIDWVVKNVPNNNGRVGMWGISYPGFYTAVGMIHSHPALKAASPQAPIADWFIGDDFHHNGALYLMDAFLFLSSFGKPRPEPTTRGSSRIKLPYPDVYRFFLQMGSNAAADRDYFKGSVAFWNEMMKHDTYDEYWQARNLLPHLKGITCAVLTVGGWYDCEDLYGPLNIHATVNKLNPGIFNGIVIGPWPHGGWARSSITQFGDVAFGQDTSKYYQENIEFPFFMKFLKPMNANSPPKAQVFLTGSNTWKQFDRWPPSGVSPRTFYMYPGGALGDQRPSTKSALFDEYLSDPNRPVPYSNEVRGTRRNEYMNEDQRFAWRRHDVLSYQTPPLASDLTLTGPIQANLFVSTSGTDADFIVKVIDVYPDNLPDPDPNPNDVHLGGYQQLVRGEVMRGKFRKSYSTPTPFVPNRVESVSFGLRDVGHTFKKGHRLMVQVQSTWFPLVDRNPQQFMKINQAKPSDFKKATIQVHRSADAPSNITVTVLPG